MLKYFIKNKQMTTCTYFMFGSRVIGWTALQFEFNFSGCCVYVYDLAMPGLVSEL